MMGRRCPEIACGGLEQFLDETLERELAQFVLIHCRGLSDVQRSNLMSDWTNGRQSLALQLRIKTHPWKVLPLRLCGLGHRDETLARVSAGVCVAQWAQASPRQRTEAHPLSQAVLGPGFEGACFQLMGAVNSLILFTLPPSTRRPSNHSVSGSLLIFLFVCCLASMLLHSAHRSHVCVSELMVAGPDVCSPGPGRPIFRPVVFMWQCCVSERRVRSEVIRAGSLSRSCVAQT